MLSLFAVCVWTLYKLCSCYASPFVIGNATLQRNARELAIGFDNSTNTVLLFGGRYFQQQFVKFKNHQFIDEGEDYLPYETRSTGQHYTQMNHRLWMIDTLGAYIFAVDTITYIADESTVPLPAIIAHRACLASNQHYLFVVGGLNISSNNGQQRAYCYFHTE